MTFTTPGGNSALLTLMGARLVWVILSTASSIRCRRLVRTISPKKTRGSGCPRFLRRCGLPGLILARGRSSRLGRSAAEDREHPANPEHVFAGSQRLRTIAFMSTRHSTAAKNARRLAPRAVALKHSGGLPSLSARHETVPKVRRFRQRQ